jgi:DNA-binding NarL/FixJ family response regulator
MSQQTSTAPISILIVEDDSVTQRALCLAIETEPAMKLAAALDTVKAAREWLELHTADILLIDLGLPDGSGIDVIQTCAQLHPRCGIMVITMSSDEASVLATIEAGASGYVLKGASRLDIVHAILDMHAGGSPMSPAIARMVLSRIRDNQKTAFVVEESAENVAAFGGLTKREATILSLIARGDTYSEVAKFLSVSVGTVQTHIKNIYGKLAVHSRSEAVFEAHRRGLLQLGLPGAKS